MTLAILGVLASIAIPAYTGYERSGARQEATTNLQGLSLCLEQYYADNAFYNSPGAVLPASYTWAADANGVVTKNDFANWLSSFVPKKTAATVNNYEYVLNVTAPSAYTALAIPVRGPVLNDGNLSIDNSGDKLPANKW